MALENYIEPEIGVAVAVTAILASPPLRDWLRRGLVLGMAGVMVAGDTASTMVRGMSRGMHQSDDASEMAQDSEAGDIGTGDSVIVVPDPGASVDGMMANGASPAPRRRRAAKGVANV